MEGYVVLPGQSIVFNSGYVFVVDGYYLAVQRQQPLIQIPITAQSIITCVADVEAYRILEQSIVVAVSKEVNQYLSVIGDIETLTAIQIAKDAEIPSLILVSGESIITCVADVEAEKIFGQSLIVAVSKEVNQCLLVSHNIETFSTIQIAKDAEIPSLILVSGESIITPKADVTKDCEIGLDGLLVSSDTILQIPLELSTSASVWLPGILVEKDIVVGQASCVAKEIEANHRLMVSTNISIETRALVAQQIYIYCLMEAEMAEVKPLLMRPNGDYEQMEPFDFINSRNGPRIPITMATGDTEWIALVPAWLSVGLRVVPTFCLPVTNANGSISLISLGV